MKISQLIKSKTSASRSLPFTSRILNFVSIFGAIATFISLIARIISGMPFLSILIIAMLFIALVIYYWALSSFLYEPKKSTTIFLYILGLVVWPAMFFTTGGVESGLSAYFVLVIILDFLLLKGKTRIFSLIFATLSISFCYISTIYFDFSVLPTDGLNSFQVLIDNLQSIFVAGFFLGGVLVFQNKVYLEEKRKAEGATAQAKRNEELLTLVNESATKLLTCESNNFDKTLKMCMKNIAECLDIDCVFIWRLVNQNGESFYGLAHYWMSQEVDRKSIGKLIDKNIMPRVSDWDERMFCPKGYLAEVSENFGSYVRERLDAVGVKAIMGFPVFFQGKYWGFVSYENRSDTKLCSESEAVILRSGSLLMANSIERNENNLQLTKRLNQQQLMSNIAKSFISREPLGDLIRSSLAKMGEFLNVERVLVAVFEKSGDISRPEYFWFSEPAYRPNAFQTGFASIIREHFPTLASSSSEEIKNIYCDNAIEYLNGKFMPLYERGKVKAFIGVPIYVNDELWGMISIEKLTDFRHWDKNDSQLVSLVSSAISNAVARDVIEKERTVALKQAIEASRAKGEFLSNMSHEIRTPMNAIIGMTAIGRQSSAIEKKDYAFDKIANASSHLLGVINDILDMSKIEANKLELSTMNFNFENMIQRVVNVINFRVDERRQHLYVNIDGRIPQMLSGDDQRLSQVIANLLSNAVKFTPENGTISLNAMLVDEDEVDEIEVDEVDEGEGDEDEGEVEGLEVGESGKFGESGKSGESADSEGVCTIRVEVADTGIGITAEQKERLFHSFEQAEAGTSRKYGGTGLGLAISKRIVNLMGGDIWAESEVGKGSKFVFTAKLVRAMGGRNQMLKEGVDWHNIKIFAVDDEPQVREFFKSTSATLGISCVTASSGEEAVQMLLDENNFDIYFVDWKLTGINGVELVERIHSFAKHNFVTVLFSSCDWNEIEEEAKRAGVDRFLAKPLFRSDIVNLINELIAPQTQNEGMDKGGEESDYSKFCVLLAEDVDINREIFASLLEDTKINIDFAHNGERAVEMFSRDQSKYDLIFMDVQMPQMDGYQATRQIRAIGSLKAKNIPIVAMTANVFKEDVQKCLESGMNGHVGKPIDISDILKILKKYLKA